MPILDRKFIHKGCEYTVKVSPAALQDASGRTIHYYPSQREEIVEDVIRKLASQKNGLFLDDAAAVKFTLYEVREELLKIGHGYSTDAIKQAIEICSNTLIKITSKEGNEVSVTSTIFPFVGIETKKIDGGKNKVVVMFHPLVTRSINEGTYRLINYEQVMNYKMPLARWLHKRISHNFLQATPEHPYRIKLSTIIRDSGMKKYQKLPNNIRQICKAMEEMVIGGALARYEQERIEEKRKILDVIFSLYVSDSFRNDVKKANKANPNLQEKLRNKELNATGDQSKNSISEQDKAIIGRARELDTEIRKEKYSLSETLVGKILSKVNSERKSQQILLSLKAASEYFDKNPACNRAAVTRSAIDDGWMPQLKDKASITNGSDSPGLSQLTQGKDELKYDDNSSLWKEFLASALKHDSLRSDVNLKKLLTQIKFLFFTNLCLYIAVPTKFNRDSLVGAWGKVLMAIFKQIEPNARTIFVVSEEDKYSCLDISKETFMFTPEILLTNKEIKTNLLS